MTMREKLLKLTAMLHKAQVAKRVGVAPMTMSNYLSGRTSPSVEIAVKLARVLGVDPGWFVDDAKGWPPVRIEEIAEVSAVGSAA